MAAVAPSHWDERLVEAEQMLLGDGRPFDPAQAIALLLAGAEEGHAASALRAATVVATGLIRPPDWDAALDLLLRAATLGDGSARAQMALLSGREAHEFSAASEIDLRRARTAMDPQALLQPRQIRTLVESPLIGVVEGFATPQMAAWIVQEAEPRLRRSEINDHRTGEVREDAARTCTSTVLGLRQRDLVICLLQARAARITGLPVALHEAPNVLSYLPGQTFEAHVDFIDPDYPHFRDELAALGQRVATCITYLNDDYEGGETAFLDIGFKFRGRRGDCLVFRNVRPDRTPDRTTTHTGLPPTRGRKWMLSQWLRDRPQVLV